MCDKLLSIFLTVTMSNLPIEDDLDETFSREFKVKLQVSSIEATSGTAINNLEETPTQESTKEERKQSLLKKKQGSRRKLFPSVHPSGDLEHERQEPRSENPPALSPLGEETSVHPSGDLEHERQEPRSENPSAPSPLVALGAKIKEYFEEPLETLQDGDIRQYFKGKEAVSKDLNLLLSEMLKARISNGRELDFDKLKNPGIYYFNLHQDVCFPDPPNTNITCHYVGLSQNVYTRMRGHIYKKNKLIDIDKQLARLPTYTPDQLSSINDELIAINEQLDEYHKYKEKKRRRLINQKDKLEAILDECRQRKKLMKENNKIITIDKQLAKYPPAEHKTSWTFQVVMLDEIRGTGMIDTIEKLQPIKDDKALLPVLEKIGIMKMKSLYPNGYNMMLHMPRSLTYVDYEFTFKD